MAERKPVTPNKNDANHTYSGEKKRYNYCCLFSEDNSCPNHNKTIVKHGTEHEKCDHCGSELKVLGEALNVVFIGTQESKIK